MTPDQRFAMVILGLAFGAILAVVFLGHALFVEHYRRERLCEIIAVYHPDSLIYEPEHLGCHS